MKEGLMGIKQLQEYLGVSKKTAYKLIRSGRIKAAKVGRKWVVRVRNVEKYIDEQGNI